MIGLLIGTACVLSLSWAIHDTAADPQAAYFSMPVRVWELGFGAALALLAERRPALPQIPRELLGWLGLAMIVGSRPALFGPNALPGRCRAAACDRGGPDHCRRHDAYASRGRPHTRDPSAAVHRGPLLRVLSVALPGADPRVAGRWTGTPRQVPTSSYSQEPSCSQHSHTSSMKTAAVRALAPRLAHRRARPDRPARVRHRGDWSRSPRSRARWPLKPLLPQRPTSTP